MEPNKNAVFVVGVAWLCGAHLAGVAASRKGQGYGMAFMAGLLLTPVIGLLYAAALPDRLASSELFGRLGAIKAKLDEAFGDGARTPMPALCIDCGERPAASPSPFCASCRPK